MLLVPGQGIDRDVLEVTAEPDLSDQVDELRAGSRPMQMMMRSRKGGRERAKEERVSLFLLRCRSCSNEPRYEPHGQPRPGSRLRKPEPALRPALGPPPVGAALNTHQCAHTASPLSHFPHACTGSPPLAVMLAPSHARTHTHTPSHTTTHITHHHTSLRCFLRPTHVRPGPAHTDVQRMCSEGGYLP